jgi:ribosomal protein S18 acetylase RimI-like enzyme
MAGRPCVITTDYTANTGAALYFWGMMKSPDEKYTEIRDASTTDIPLLQQLAEATWWPTYSPILEEKQIRYMLDLIYSREALERVMTDGSQHFILLYEGNTAQAFAAYGPYEDGAIKLHKLYVLPQNHGKGYGRILIDEVIRRTRAGGAQTLVLNVNRHNNARTFYEKLGFRVMRETDVPIGPFWMNDYVMELSL